MVSGLLWILINDIFLFIKTELQKKTLKKMSVSIGTQF